MNILQLTLKKKWFNMIASGEKTEEYREIKPYWNKRLRSSIGIQKWFDVVHFRNGYRPDSPAVTVQWINTHIGRGNPEWGAPVDKDVFIVTLGKRVKGSQS